VERQKSNAKSSEKRAAGQRQKVFAVLGLGVFGRQICETLVNRGGSVIAIDQNPELIEQVKETVTQAVLINTTMRSRCRRRRSKT